MPAKAPIYMKPNGGKNGTGNGKGGKKLRELLSTEMISLPLGDFRHMAHVGRGGANDMFGDTTFLKKKSSTDAEKANGNGMRRKGSGRSSKKMRNNSVPDSSAIKSEKSSLSNHSYDGYGATESPILQSAFSLPLLNQESTSAPNTPVHNQDKDEKKVKKTKKTMNNNCISNGKATSHETGLDTIATTPNGGLNGPPKPRRLTVEDGTGQNGHIGNGIKGNEANNKQEVAFKKPGVTSPSDTTSIDESWALELDLGSSLMDDVMGIMDKIEL